MFKVVFSVFLSFCALFLPIQAKPLADVDFYAQGSVYYLGVIHVYDASLYLPADVTAQDILAAETSRCLKLDYKVDLDKAKFIQAATTILERQYPQDQQAALENVQASIDRLHKAYKDVKNGDRYWLCYQASTQETSLYLNDQSLLNLPDSAEFAAVYMGIWLSEKEPISTSLRESLLSIS